MAELAESPRAPVLQYGNQSTSPVPRLSGLAVAAACLPLIDPALFLVLRNVHPVVPRGPLRLLLLLPVVLFVATPVFSLIVALAARARLRELPHLRGHVLVRVALLLSSLESAFILFSVVGTVLTVVRAG